MKGKIHRYVVYGIGSAGSCVPNGTRKESDTDVRKARVDEETLCQDDLADLENYCHQVEEEKGVHMLQGVHNSTSDKPLTKAEVMSEITNIILETAIIEAHLVLYYTGNGEAKTGNWCFSDGIVSFAELSELVFAHRRNKVTMGVFCV